MKKMCFTLLAITGMLLAACGPVISIAPPRPQSSPEPTAENQFDFGDAPETYPVTLLADGARTHDPYQFWLGPLDSAASLETDAKTVDLDEAEDGLENFLQSGEKLSLTLRLSHAPTSPAGVIYLNGLIDINSDGDWADPGERILTNQVMNLIPGEGKTAQVLIPLPATETWLRLLVTDVLVADNWNGEGSWQLGEVEDYHILIETFVPPTDWPPPWTQIPPTKTATPEKVITTIPGDNPTPTPTPEGKPTWICTKCGGPTDTPTPTDPSPPAETPVWSGNICGGVDLFDSPGGNFIRRIGQDEHVYMLEIRDDGWTRIKVGQDFGWIQPNWSDPNAFGYEGRSCS